MHTSTFWPLPTGACEPVKISLNKFRNVTKVSTPTLTDMLTTQLSYSTRCKLLEDELFAFAFPINRYSVLVAPTSANASAKDS